MATTEAERKKQVRETAAARMTRAIKAISAVGNLNRYKLSQKQADACINTLKKAVDLADTQIRRSSVKGESLFTLPE